jgi:hypothetical protein
VLHAFSFSLLAPFFTPEEPVIYSPLCLLPYSFYLCAGARSLPAPLLQWNMGPDQHAQLDGFSLFLPFPSRVAVLLVAGKYIVFGRRSSIENMLIPLLGFWGWGANLQFLQQNNIVREPLFGFILTVRFPLNSLPPGSSSADTVPCTSISEPSAAPCLRLSSRRSPNRPSTTITLRLLATHTRLSRTG